jgi:tRNA 2-selenouridine synthase
MSERHAVALRVNVDALAAFPERVDVRSPAEFALDHLPGAVSLPVLDDTERARIGTLYTGSAFEARRLGAALVARNIAAMLDGPLADKPRDWQPLVYCWRGGQRSRALAHILNEVGWRAMQLDGGYRAYRRHVVGQLEVLPSRFQFVVLCGLTGSGKSRLLAALSTAGAQTLDLEGIARHRGSLLGEFPDAVQPSQKAFETAIAAALSALDPAHVVFVESESKRIGRLQVPETLLGRMRRARSLTLVAALAQRVALIKEEYGSYMDDPIPLTQRLEPLTPLLGKAVLKRGEDFAAEKDWDALIGELLSLHYDPLYTRSLERHFLAGSASGDDTIHVADASAAAFAALATEVIAMKATQSPLLMETHERR